MRYLVLYAYVILIWTRNSWNGKDTQVVILCNKIMVYDKQKAEKLLDMYTEASERI